MLTNKSPAERVPELARLTAKLEFCESRLISLEERPSRHDGWEPKPPEELAEATAERARLERELSEVKPALDALLTEFRVGTPAEVAACAFALTTIPSDAALALTEKLMARGGFDPAMVVPALEAALANESFFVRVRAWNGIVSAFRLDSRINGPKGAYDPSTEIELWRSFLECYTPVFMEIGAEGMRGLIRQLQAGASLESLGLAWQPNRAAGLIQRLRSVLPKDGAALPVEEIAQLTGADRYLAEAMIAVRLDKRDERAPAALAQLGAKWTVPLLKSPTFPAMVFPLFHEHVTQSLRVLESADQTPAEGVRELE